MKLRNRILSAVMAIAACMTFVGTSAFATDGYAWTWTSSANGAIEVGTEFTVTLDITENAGLINLNAEVAYDAEALEMTAKPTITTILGTNASLGAVANPYTISVGDGLENVYATGTLATFSFKALKDGNHEVTLSPDTENTIDEMFESVDFGAKSVTIEVGAGTNIVRAEYAVEEKDNKADKAEGEAYTQGFKVEVIGNDETVTAVPFTLKADGKEKAYAGFTGLNITGATPVYFGLNVKDVPADKTVAAEFSLTVAE